jgi:hypothetical protein
MFDAGTLKKFTTAGAYFRDGRFVPDAEVRQLSFENVCEKFVN